MKYYVLLQASGDNLITLQMLDQLKEEVNIIGTKGTRDIANMIGVSSNINIMVAFREVPSFYRVRDKGIIKALVDILRFRVLIKKLKPTCLVFEKGGMRAKLLSFGISELLYSDITKHAYINRRLLIEKSSNSFVSLKLSALPGKNIKNILICPSSGSVSRNISRKDLKSMIEIFSRCQYNIKIIDYAGEYKDFKSTVNQYFSNTSLISARELIKESDFFVGTDSFLIHLAYFYNKSFFIVFNYEYFDFLPPGCEVIGNYVIINPLEDNKNKIKRRLSLLGVL